MIFASSSWGVSRNSMFFSIIPMQPYYIVASILCSTIPIEPQYTVVFRFFSITLSWGRASVHEYVDLHECWLGPLPCGLGFRAYGVCRLGLQGLVAILGVNVCYQQETQRFFLFLGWEPGLSYNSHRGFILTFVNSYGQPQQSSNTAALERLYR